MIILFDNFISSVDVEGENTSAPEDVEGENSSVPEDVEGENTFVSEDVEGENTSVPEDLPGENISVLDESSATGETQQSAIPTIINDIVVPDNSYSKYCFFFLMLLFALFVGRSFRKGV